MELAEEGKGLLETAQRLFAGRDGRIALTLVLVVTATVEASVYAHQRGNLAAAVIVNVLAVVPLLASRRFPFLAAAATTFWTFVDLGSPKAPLTVTGLGVLLYLIGNLVVRRGLVWGLPFLVPFLFNAMVPFGGGDTSPESVAPLLLVAAAILVGESTRKRSAEAELGVAQEAMAESLQEQTAMEERARIARELHDIVAHHLSVIAVQSETARLTSPKLSTDARGRFEAIAQTARDALSETRRLLGVLREDVGGEADRAPQPGLDQLTELVDTARDTGTEVRLILRGKVVHLPAGIDLAAYRIVQEALTNARRHAPGADVDVEVSYRDDALTLRIRDYGPGTRDGELLPGHGLVGMRDRTTVAGGTFTAGDAEGGGFAVEATLPMPGDHS
ncbi:MAG TPA: sensor histidine kinase [Gaiellaceae bacterium]|nr:sensor histidine kinase [Gaiellaceae bacterium]